MFFTEEFVKKISDDPVIGIIDTIRSATDALSSETGYSDEDYDLLLECLSLVLTISEQYEVTLPSQAPKLQGRGEDSQQIVRFLTQVRDALKTRKENRRLADLRRKHAMLLGGFVYEFSQGDLERIQILIIELKDQIINNKFIEEEHKRRLLRRLEALQSNLHKKMSELDRFWGLVGDAGVVVGKCGADVKPIVDRIREITGIVWRTQARAEELSSDTQNLLTRLYDDKDSNP